MAETMARLARGIAPGLPPHITQRGNRRQVTFFGADDSHAYVALLGEWWWYWHVEVWAYRLMPNHVHLIAIPPSEDGLRRTLGEAHRRYPRRMNFRDSFVVALEGQLGRTLQRGKPGPTRDSAA